MASPRSVYDLTRSRPNLRSRAPLGEFAVHTKCKLDVLIEGWLAGSLDLSDTARPKLRYERSYLQKPDATPLSTLFPLEDRLVSGEPLRHWLAGVLPERVLRALCEEYGVPTIDRLTLLGTPIGRECAGAVQFSQGSHTQSLLDGEGGLVTISNDDVLEWLHKLRSNPAYRPEPTLVSSGFSLAGMQPKIALRFEDNQWHVPWGAEPSSHIIKVARSGVFDHEAIIEHLTMRTAERMGETELRETQQSVPQVCWVDRASIKNN